MKIIQTIIVGLGKVGFGNTKDYMLYRSHCYSISRLKEFQLIAAVDKKTVNRIKFEKKYKIKSYQSISKIKKKADLVIISSDTKNHYQSIKDTLRYIKPKFIICEKPFTDSYDKAKKIHIICKKYKINLYVNYVRRCLPSVIKLKNFLNKNDNKYYLKVFYPTGLLNNGSHFIDLCTFFFGRNIGLERTGYIKKNKLKNDFNVKFKIKFKNALAEFFPCPKSKGSTIIIRSNKFNLLWKKGKKIEVIFNTKNNNKKLIESDMKSYQYYVMREFLKKINHQKSSICTSAESLKTQEIIKKLKKI